MKIVTVVGARPQFVKAAVVSRAFKQYRNDIDEIIVHTGQHYDKNMSEVFFEEMSIPKPQYNLGVGGGMHGKNTGRMLEKIESVLCDEKPDYLLVYGDTDSTLAGALASAKLHIPVAHIEAGLRSFNMKMPEEINRILTDRVSSILFCPTELAVANLLQEGISKDKVKVTHTGDVMYDAAMFYQSNSRKPEQLTRAVNNFVLCTIHRAENTDSQKCMQNIVTAINDIAKSSTVILPVHPRTRKLLQSYNLSFDTNNIFLLDPVGYFEMLWLLKHCNSVITDSGGLQKEAYFFSKPCITLREQTEWVELVESGVNMLAPPLDNEIFNLFFLKKLIVTRSVKEIPTFDFEYSKSNVG